MTETAGSVPRQTVIRMQWIPPPVLGLKYLKNDPASIGIGTTPPQLMVMDTPSLGGYCLSITLLGINHVVGKIEILSFKIKMRLFFFVSPTHATYCIAVI